MNRPLKPLRTLPHTGEIYSLAFSPDGKFLVTASEHRAARQRERPAAPAQDTAPPVHEPIPAQQSSSISIVSRIGEWLHGRLRFWSTFSGQEIPVLGEKAGEYKSPNLTLWNTVTGRQMTDFEDEGPSVNAVAFSPDGRFLASGEGSVLKLWRVPGA